MLSKINKLVWDSIIESEEGLLKATDFDPNNILFVKHQDGSSFIFHSVIYRMVEGGYLVVIPEHNTPMAFHLEDLELASFHIHKEHRRVVLYHAE